MLILRLMPIILHNKVSITLIQVNNSLQSFIPHANMISDKNMINMWLII